MNFNSVKQIFGGATAVPGGIRSMKISENYHVSGQISPADVAAAKANGFSAIMCNRPDGESFGQPHSDEIKQAAQEHGLNFYYIPVSHTGMAADTLQNFRDAVTQESGKMLAYCRSGNRCAMLWQMSGNS